MHRLREALSGGEPIHTTGIVLQGLLQGFRGAKSQEQIVERFKAIAMITPARDDYIKAAQLCNEYRRRDIQVGTIDTLLAQPCLQHDLVMLTTDHDFRHAANWTPLQLWRAS